MSINNYFDGTIIGLSQTIVGHPFDTIKVYIQNNSLKQFKSKYLLNGIRYPIYSNIISNTLIFGNYDTLLYYYNGNVLKASLVTGVVNSFVINHLDYIKTNKQLNRSLDVFKISNIGLQYTLLRECLSTPIYFMTYNILRNEKYNSFFSGGTAGILSWLFTYNIDTFKTRKQLNPNLTFIDIYNKGNFYRGIYVCLIRAFLVNGVAFTLYDKLK